MIRLNVTPSEMTSKSDPIIIVGSGVYGLSSAYHLAVQGYTNIKVFDRGDYAANDYSPLKGADGASTDLNKLIRASYVDKVHYQDLAIEAIEKFYVWNSEFLKLSFLPPALNEIQDRCLKQGDQEPIFQNTGYIRLDDYDSGEEKYNLMSFEKAGLRKLSYDINDPEDVARAKITGWYKKMDPMNQRGKVPGLTGVLDSFAGVALADKCLLWVKYMCERTGSVELIYGEGKGAVESLVFSSDDKTKVIGIKTKDGNVHHGNQVVLSAGAWIPSLVNDLSPRLESVASSYIMIQIPKDRQDLLNKYRAIPMINWRMTYERDFRKDSMYMFPATHDGVLKMGVNDHFWRYLKKLESGEIIGVPNTTYKLLPKESLDDYKKFIKEFLPDIYMSGAKIEKSKLCFASVGQKNELVIDYVPGYKNLIVCAGGGFHGFKFLPVIGKFTEGLISQKEYLHNEYFRFDKIKEKEYTLPVTSLNHEHALNSVEFTSSRTDYYKL